MEELDQIPSRVKALYKERHSIKPLNPPHAQLNTREKSLPGPPKGRNLKWPFKHAWHPAPLEALVLTPCSAHVEAPRLLAASGLHATIGSYCQE